MGSSTLSSAASGSLIFREYSKFRGVDFSNRKDEISLQHSPDALNMWKNYKNSNGLCVETRPSLEGVKEYEDNIYGMYFYNFNRIMHIGNKLYENEKVIFEGLERHKSIGFIYNTLIDEDKKIYKTFLYVLDGTKYFMYDGEEVKEVEGFIPTTTISRKPSGGGERKQDVNLLTGIRKNQFCADGKSTEYFVDSEEFDEDYTVKAWINGDETTAFTAYPKLGKIVFSTAPDEPDTVGQDNVTIQFRKTVEGAREKITHCTIGQVFDDRVFFAGNPDYPNMLFYCSLDNPMYCSDLDYYTEGSDGSAIKALIVGNNALWVMKEPNQNNTTIFYHNPSIDDEDGKIYPSSHSSISTGCVSTGVNFNDDIIFFSERGMESISSDVRSEQAISHRSSLVDNRLLNEEHYKDMILEEWEGYLLVFTHNKVYLADSRAKVSLNGHAEYEWFYWELEEEITGTYVKDGVLFLYSNNKLYTLTNNNPEREITSYFCTMADEMNYPQMWKTTNKKGTVVDCEGEQIALYTKKDNEEFSKVGTYSTDDKGYFKPRIKAKKFKSVQLKFESELPFSLYSATLEAYIGNVVKR